MARAHTDRTYERELKDLRERLLAFAGHAVERGHHLGRPGPGRGKRRRAARHQRYITALIASQSRSIVAGSRGSRMGSRSSA